GGIASAAGRAGAPRLRRGLFQPLHVGGAVPRGLVDVGGAPVGAIRQPDEYVVAEAEWLGDLLADEGAVVGLRQRLDQRRRHPVGRAGVIVDARAGRPLER